MEKVDLGKVTGKSAYEIALDNGFEGTEEEWLESLKGESSSGGNNVAYVDNNEKEIHDKTQPLFLNMTSDYERLTLDGLIYNNKIFKVDSLDYTKQKITNYTLVDNHNFLYLLYENSYGSVSTNPGSLGWQDGDFFIQNNGDYLVLLSYQPIKNVLTIHDVIQIPAEMKKYVNFVNSVYIHCFDSTSDFKKYLFIHNLYDSSLNNIVISTFEENNMFSVWDMMKELYMNRDASWYQSYFENGVGADIVLNKKGNLINFCGGKKDLFIMTNDDVWSISSFNTMLSTQKPNVKVDTYVYQSMVFCENGLIIKEEAFPEYILTGDIDESSVLSNKHVNNFISRDFILVETSKQNGWLYFKFKNLKTFEEKEIYHEGVSYQSKSILENIIMINDENFKRTNINLNTSDISKGYIPDFYRSITEVPYFYDDDAFNKRWFMGNGTVFGSRNAIHFSLEGIEHKGDLIEIFFGWSGLELNKYTKKLKFTEIGNLSNEEEEW